MFSFVVGVCNEIFAIPFAIEFRKEFDRKTRTSAILLLFGCFFIGVEFD